MRTLSLTAANYAKFTAVVNSLGTPTNVYYAQNGGFLLDAHVLFQDRDAALNVTFQSSTVATSTLTTDFPAAIDAAVNIS